MATARPVISAVVPLYNEETGVAPLVARLCAALAAISPDYEVILVDDGSSDRTLEHVRQAHRADPRVRGLSLSRNFGHQLAVTAGFDTARGEAVAILDGDLQDPPELLPQMLALLRRGHDVVYAVRRSRREGLAKRLSYWLFYRLMAWLADVDMPLDTGDFCLMDRQVADAIRAMPERRRFLRGLRSWVGFRQVQLPYDRDSRFAGTSKYTLKKLFGLAFEGIFTMSEKPLRVATLAGLATAGLSFLAAVRVVVWKLFVDDGENIGYASLAIGIFVLGSLQLVSIGVLGEYIGRIHHEVKGRPPYLVRERVGAGELPLALAETG